MAWEPPPPQGGPISVQVVFQGGGARLCHLVAVCDALREMERDNRVRVTRVAGSSAGAIAAAMFASSRTIADFRADIKKLVERHADKLKRRDLLGLWSIFRGKSYFSDINLVNIFSELFPQVGGNGQAKIEQLRIPTEIYYTDLLSLGVRSCEGTEVIASALAKSCRIPLAFSGYTSDLHDVDGGLAENLPVDRLRADESRFGPTLAISFERMSGPGKHKNLVDYLLHLFSTSIQASVTRSEAVIGPGNLYKINSPLDVFDFEQGVSVWLFSEEYERERARFTGWLSGWLAARGAEPSQAGVPRLVRPSLTSQPLPAAIINDLDYYSRSDPPTHARRIQTFECALLNPDGGFEGSYRTRMVMNFVAKRQVRVLQFDFQTGVGPFSNAKFGCSVMDERGRPLAFVPYVHQIQAPEENRVDYRALILFETPIVPEDGEFAIELVYTAPDSYPDLGKKPETSAFLRKQGAADEISLAVAFPRSRIGTSPYLIDLAELPESESERIGYYRDEGEVLVRSDPMNAPEFVDGLRLDYPADQYFLCGRRGRNIAQLQAIGFALDSRPFRV